MTARSAVFAAPAGETLAILVILISIWASPIWAQGQLDPSDLSARINQLATAGGSLDDVVQLLGQPQSYRWSGQTFTPDNLPDRYLATYSNGVNVLIVSGFVQEIRLERGPAEYRFADMLAIGSSLDDALATLGQPTRTVSNQVVEAFQDNVLYRNCSRPRGTPLNYYRRSDKGVSIFLSNDKVVGIYLTVARPATSAAPRRGQPAPPTPSPEPLREVQEFDDVRNKDISAADLRWRPDLIPTLKFNQATVWPPPERMPLEADPAKLLEDAKNPGLGVRQLHAQGITGKGVCVAIIDQPLYGDHPEYAGKIVAYHDVGCRGETSMHGPATASLLVGSTCGTAPEATLYFVAAPSWTLDAAYYAKALDWIVEQNASLPPDGKIRVVSVSAGPSGPGTNFTKNTDMWDDACKRAERAGLLVLDCTAHHGFISRCYLDSNDPEDVTRCTPGAPGEPQHGQPGELFVPSSPRTVAEESARGQHGYIHFGRGGLSWSPPYAAGVLAMGWQIRPDISPEIMRGLLFRSAYVKDRTTRIINPPEFIRAVREWRSSRPPPATTPTTTATAPAPGPTTEPASAPADES